MTRFCAAFVHFLSVDGCRSAVEHKDNWEYCGGRRASNSTSSIRQSGIIPRNWARRRESMGLHGMTLLRLWHIHAVGLRCSLILARLTGSIVFCDAGSSVGHVEAAVFACRQLQHVRGIRTLRIGDIFRSRVVLRAALLGIMQLP